MRVYIAGAMTGVFKYKEKFKGGFSIESRYF